MEKGANKNHPETNDLTVPRRKPLGEIFVEKGLLTQTSVNRLVAVSKKKGKRFGTLLEDLELVTGEELAEALAAQFHLGVVKDFHRYRFPEELLQVIPCNLAIENTIFPLRLREGQLAVAVSDPTNTRILRNFAINKELRLVPYIATREDIHKAITVHYLRRDVQHASEKKRVLVVDDDRLIRTALTSILARETYEVVSACDGMEAFREIIACVPDLIICDKEMPKLDGYALYDSVRKVPETARTPVILMSSAATAEEEAAAFEKGFFDFIPKPIKEATLLVKARRAIASSSLI